MQWFALSTVQQAELAERLVTSPYRGNAWDIWTLKFCANVAVATPPLAAIHSQTICTLAAGIDPTSTGVNGNPKFVVTVKDGSGSPEEYPTDAVNYYLYGCIMRLAYTSWKAILFDATNHPSWFTVNSLTKMWIPDPEDGTHEDAKRWNWTWANTRLMVTGHRGNFIFDNPYARRFGNRFARGLCRGRLVQ